MARKAHRELGLMRCRRIWQLPFTLPDTFITARLLLRPIAVNDTQAIFDTYGQDVEVCRYLTWRPHRSIEDAENYVQACLTAPTSRTYAMVRRDTNKLVGAFDLRHAGVAKLSHGYVLARPFWGQGLMTEALTQVVDWALRQPTIWRIGDVVDVDNHASARVMEKAGLEREGLLRRWMIHPNIGEAPRDCLSYAKTR